MKLLIKQEENLLKEIGEDIHNTLQSLTPFERSSDFTNLKWKQIYPNYRIQSLKLKNLNTVGTRMILKPIRLAHGRARLTDRDIRGQS